MPRNRICFLVGSAALSGGSYVIFQHASYAVDQGYDVTLAVQEPFDKQTVAWHDQSAKLRFVPIDVARNEAFDLVIATWWKTALELSSFNAPRYAYFVQSIESRFYSDAERPLKALVDATYQFPISYVTEAQWIVEHLRSLFGRNAALVRNGIRKDIYAEAGPTIAPRPVGQPRVLIEGHFGVPFKNTALALKLAREAGAKDIWVMTGSPVQSIHGVSRVFSRVPIHKTPEIYRSCDILVKLSTVEGMFGPPLEIFHCGGTAIVFDVTGHDEYIQHEVNAIVVKDRNTNRVVSELKQLLKTPERLEALKEGARQTAGAWPDWPNTSELFKQWIDKTLEEPETDRGQVKTLTKSAWDQYGIAEKQRLKEHPSITWSYKLKGLARRLPRWAQDGVKQVMTMKEVMFPPRRVN